MGAGSVSGVCRLGVLANSVIEQVEYYGLRLRWREIVKGIWCQGLSWHRQGRKGNPIRRWT